MGNMYGDAKRIADKAAAALTSAQFNKACTILLTNIKSNVWKKIKAEIAKNPHEWWVGYHFGWGMAVRNLLREYGFTDKESKSGNLDDIYTSLVEEAARRAK